MPWAEVLYVQREWRRWQLCRRARLLAGQALPRAPVELAGLEFPNALGLAAGVTPRGRGVGELARLGFGHIEVGTLAVDAASAGMQRRCARRLAAVQRLPADRRPRIGISLRPANETGLNGAADEWRRTLAAFWPLVDYWVLNLSLPGSAMRRTGDVLMKLPRGVSALQHIAAALEQRTGMRRPMLFKIACDEQNDAAALRLLRIARSLGADAAIVAFERWRRPEGIPHAIRALQQELRPLPIIAVGGVRTAGDMLAYLGAGAALVQCYSLPIQETPFAMRRMIEHAAAITATPHAAIRAV